MRMQVVILDFVKPLWAGRDLGCIGRQAELERLKHADRYPRLLLRIGYRGSSVRDYSVCAPRIVQKRTEKEGAFPLKSTSGLVKIVGRHGWISRPDISDVFDGS
jgi:hypothetical protein